MSYNESRSVPKVSFQNGEATKNDFIYPLKEIKMNIGQALLILIA